MWIRTRGRQDSKLVECQTSDQKVASSGRSSGRIFYLSELFMLTLIWCLLPPPSPPLQLHVKDPVTSAKSTGGRLHLNMHETLNQQSQSGLRMLSRHSVGTYQEKRVYTQLIRKRLATVISAH